jgi:anti-sigma factor RsiW
VTATAPLQHARAFELLPWLVNGTLTGAERDAVEEHVRACIACRRELKAQQQLQVALRRTGDISAEAGLDDLERRLDAVARDGPGRPRPRYAAAAPFAIAAAAGVALLAVLVWFTPLPDVAGSSYSTLATAPAGDATSIDIVFAESTTAAEIQQLLDEIGGEIVAGPSRLGRYSVRIAEQPSSDSGLTELIGTLAADRRVRFAGRSLSEGEP